MRRVIAVASFMAVLAMAPAVGAQQSGGATPDAHGHGSGASPSTSAPGQPGQMPMAMCMEMMSGGGMMGRHGGMGGGGGMMGRHGGMDGGMGGPMMGMEMPGAPTDPKTMSQMMEMRGEMMKAMGDIMMRHAQRMRQAPAR